MAGHTGQLPGKSNQQTKGNLTRLFKVDSGNWATSNAQDDEGQIDYLTDVCVSVGSLQGC